MQIVFLRGKGADLLCFATLRKKPATHGVRVIATLVLRSAPFPLNNPHTLHARSGKFKKAFAFLNLILRKFASQISDIVETISKFI